MKSTAGLAGSASEVVVQYERQLSPAVIGSIWLGRLASGSETGRLVTIRRIPLDLLSAEDIERVRLGAGACARLRSPTIIKLLGVAELDGELISVSEYLAGIRLIDLERSLIESDVTIPVGVATRLVLDVARAAVAARHLMMDIGVLAPNRVLISDSALIALFGEVLLTDIGVMSPLLRSPRIAQLPGVLADLAPEEVGTNAAAAGSPEVYTLGVALWQLLTNRWVQLPQGGTRVFRDPNVSDSIPPVDSVERMGLPVPEPLARVLRQATQRDPRKRFTSLDALVDAIEQLPANCIASSRQLQAFIQQTAPQVLPECEASATWSVPARLEPVQPPPSRPISLHPNAGHDWEPPTFAERRLVAPVVSNPPQEAELEDAVAVNSIEPRRASRLRTAVLVFGAALVLTVATLVLIRMVQERHPQAVHKAKASTLAQSNSPPAAQPSATKSLAETPAEPAAAAPDGEGASVPQKQKKAATHVAPGSPNRQRASATYRPKGI
jgi:serine/threonine protein kinase